MLIWKIKKAFLFFKKEGFFSLLRVFYRKLKRSFTSRDKNVHEYLSEQFPNCRDIPFIKVENHEWRLNIVLDSLKKQSLFGGVATSLILATLFANKFNISLRIITRFTETDPQAYLKFLEMMDISKPKRVDFFSDHEYLEKTLIPSSLPCLEISEKDIFLSTSWWSSRVVKSINLRKDFFYLLQEVESLFYPNGDEKYMSENLLKDENIHFIINSKTLYDFFSHQNENNTASKNCVCFEPAFPVHLYSAIEQSFRKKDKYKLVYYSRPNNPRNMFFTGLKLIDEAFLNSTLNKDEWTIYFMGGEVPSIRFSNHAKPIVLGHMDWAQYSDLIKTIDLGFSLMYTPHPSYPPLDIAASGGVALTNRYPFKEKLHYSENILCKNLDRSSMLRGFEEAVCLVKDLERRKANYLNNRIERSWEKSFHEVLHYMYDHL